MATKTISSLNKGPWSSVATYTPGDMVSSAGSSYICIATTLNNLPPNGTYWALLAAKGEKGDQGDPGVQEVTLAGMETLSFKTLTAPILNAPVINGAVTGTSIDTDGTLGANSDTKLASQKAVKTYVNAQIAAGVNESSWLEESATPTRISNYVLTLPGDLTAIYQKGTKIWYKEGGVSEYGYVESSNYSAPTTTINLVANNDFAMGGAITDLKYSYAENPEGFPDFFAFTTTFGGFSAAPSTSVLYFKLSAHQCSFYYLDGTNGTSNGTGFTFTLPVAALKSMNNAGLIFVADNGTILTTPGHLLTTALSKTMSVFKTFSQGAFTGSGGKNMFLPMISYEWT